MSNSDQRAPASATLRAVALACGLALGAPGGAQAAVGTWTTNGPDGGRVTRVQVYAANPNLLYAFGIGGLFRSTNGGGNWLRAEVGLPDAAAPNDVAISTVSTTLYAAIASSNLVYRSADAGLTWVPTAWPGPAADTVAVLAVQPGTSNNVLAVAAGTAYVSTTGGSSWTSNAFAAGTTLSAAEYASDGTLYVGDRSGGAASCGGAWPYGNAPLAKSTTGGASWTPVGVAQDGGGNPYLCGVTIVRAARATPARLYATNGSNLITSPDSGATWALVPPPASCGGITSVDVSPTDAASIWLGCRNTGLQATTNATAASPTWTAFGAGSLTANGVNPAQIVSVAVHPNFPTTPTLWAGAENGGLFKSTNAAAPATASWTPANTGYQSVNIRAVAPHPLNANVVLAGFGDAFTTSPALYASLDGGGSWSVSNSGLNAEQIRAITIDSTTTSATPFSPFTVYAVGRSERIPAAANRDGGVYRSTDGGATWATLDTGIAIPPGSPTPYMGTVRSVVLDPRSCTSPPTPPAVCAPGSGGLHTQFIAGSGVPNLTGPGLANRSARIYKRTDAGGTWVASDTGMPLPATYGTGLQFTGGVVPLVIDPTNSSIMYAGTFLSLTDYVPGVDPTLPNGVFKSTDGGANWTLSSTGMPVVGGPGSSHQDVLSMVINPVNPSILYASTINISIPGSVPDGHVYKSIDSGATWTDASAGIAGQDVRALYIDPTVAGGNTIYAATGGNASNPGGVYRSTDGGATWNSFSLGLSADSATALAILPHIAGSPATILAGTASGVWSYTEPVDPDADGSPSGVESTVTGNVTGDGNNDGIQDSGQPGVASLVAAPSSSGSPLHALPGPATDSPAAANIQVTTAIAGGGCTQFNNSTTIDAAQYPPDPYAAPITHAPWGLVQFELPNCAAATVNVIFHGANFAPGQWIWRNYGPTTPGNDRTFAWYSYTGKARRINAETWQLTINANQLGSYRSDPANILFIGGPTRLTDTIFFDQFE